MSWLYFANRLIELPLGIVGVAMGTVLMPELTRALRGDDRAAVAHAESRGLELAVGLALPATLGLIVLSEPIVRLLFEHGAFTAADTAATAQALMWLALGLPAHVLVKALSPAFFAREDTLTPLLATLKGFAVAIVAAPSCSATCSAPSGIAAGIALGAWSSALGADPARRGDVRIFDRCRGAPAAAAHRARRRWRWARCCGWRRGSLPALAADAHGLAQAVLLLAADLGGNRDLRPVSAAFRRHRLARGG